ncbi:MAG: hypothetical protein ACRC46_13085 [Thermoguttaceae bacterium]
MKKLLLTTSAVATMVALGAASVAFGADCATSCKTTSNGKVLYELVPNVVVPDTISYRPSAKSQDSPSSLGMSSNYPASYVPYPSYYLPYPTAFRPIQNVVYPITTLPDDAAFTNTQYNGAQYNGAQYNSTPSPFDAPMTQPVAVSEVQRYSVPQTSVIASVERKQNGSPNNSLIRLVSATESDITTCEGSDEKNAATSIQQTASAWSFSSPVFKVASIPTPAIGGQASTMIQTGKLGSTQLNVPPGVYDIPLPYDKCSFGTRCGDMAPHQCPVRACIAQRLQQKKQQEQQTYQMQMQYYMQQQQQQGQQPFIPQQPSAPAGMVYPVPLPPMQVPVGNAMPLTPPASAQAAPGAITPAGLFCNTPAPRGGAQQQFPMQMQVQMPYPFNPANANGAPNGAPQQQVTYTATPMMTPYGIALVMVPQFATPTQPAQPQTGTAPQVPQPPQALPAPGTPTGTSTVQTPQVSVGAMNTSATYPVDGTTGMPQPFPYPPQMQGQMMPGQMQNQMYPPMMMPQTSLTPYDIALLVSMLKSNSRRDAMRERRSEKRSTAAQSSDPLSIFMEAWGTPVTPSGVTARMPSKTAYPWGYFGGQSSPQTTANFGGYYNNTFSTTTQPGM